MKLNKIILFVSVVLLAMQLNSFGQNQTIDGWMRAGNKPDFMIWQRSSTNYNSTPAYYLKSIFKVTDGFGTILKNLKPADYLGKREDDWLYKIGKHYRICRNVDNGDGEVQGVYLSLDNMYNRQITGSNDWTKYEVVLDVPDSSTNIGYSLIQGEGEIWFPDLTFEVVGNDVPTTDMIKKQEEIK